MYKLILNFIRKDIFNHVILLDRFDYFLFFIINKSLFYKNIFIDKKDVKLIPLFYIL